MENCCLSTAHVDQVEAKFKAENPELCAKAEASGVAVRPVIQAMLQLLGPLLLQLLNGLLNPPAPTPPAA